MIVVSDTSAISGLIQIGRVELLRILYSEIVVPEAVRNELLRSHPILPDFLRVASVANHSKLRELEAELDSGEAEAIALSIEIRADLLLIDENLGRAVAQREGLRIIGLMGVLAGAKQQGLIPSVRHEVSELESRAGFRVSAHVKDMVFKEVSE